MRAIRLTFLALLLTLAGVFGHQAEAQNTSWKTKIEHIAADEYQIIFTATIPNTYHMYDLGPYEGGPNETEFTIEPAKGVKLVGGIQALDKATVQYDEMFDMKIGWYEKSARFAQKFKLSVQKTTIEGMIDWMLCDDQSCLPPDDYEFIIDVVAVHDLAAVAAAATPKTTPTTVAVTETPTKESGAAEGQPLAVVGSDVVDVEGDTVAVSDATTQQVVAASGEITSAGVESGTSIWSLVIEAVLWGFAALLTPCVFPMVPMTVSFFMQGTKSPAHGRFRASMYGLFIIALYTLPIALLILVTRFVGGEAVTADIFNWVATHWIPNLLFFLIFITFAASFFGAFEITLPSWMVNKSDSGADRGGLGGVFFMALTLVLVSFSCTGPIVGTVIIKSTSGGEIWAPIITMFAFSVAFALPFTLLAFFPALLKKVPQSGGWLNSVKVTLGFVEVALGFKFLSVADQTYHWGILDREVYLGIWIVTFTLMGLYFLGKIKFRHDSDMKFVSVGRLTLAIITFTFVVYLIPGMWGAPLKALSGYLPPMHTHDFVVNQNATGTGGGTATTGPEFIMLADENNPGETRKPKYSEYLSLPHNLTGFFDLEEAQKYAREVGKPLFVDITGHGCVNCREMEARVWAEPAVLNLLRNEFVIVAIYVDDKMILPEEQWITTDQGRVLKGLGKINAYISLKKFGQNAQPYYIILGDEGESLVQPRGYDLDPLAFEQFLRDGITTYHKKRDK